MFNRQTNNINLTFILIAVSLLIKLFTIGANDLLVEEAYYWNYSTHLDFSYLDHPPMVALLIRLSTSLFGINEFGVRFPSIVCWILTALFSFKLTNLIKNQSGLYAVLLLAILPFFFLQSLVITPDLPLIACWSAALYYLYKALVLDQTKPWYYAGLWLGLGMISKYTIVLLGLATLIYLIFVPHARKWFGKKEPYLCFVITTVFFSPVIYWNANHDWASFAFQSTRRLNASFSFSFHELVGLFVAFLTPLGVLGFWALFQKKGANKNQIDTKAASFLRVFTLTPLLVFSLFSLSHEIKFNWIGPGLLGLIPWLAVLIYTSASRHPERREGSPLATRRSFAALRITWCGWFTTSVILLLLYSIMIGCIISGKPEALNQRVLSKYIAWSDLTRDILKHADTTKKSPIIVPMDLYNIASELRFYQAKFEALQERTKQYTIIGRNVFGLDSLMYRYWTTTQLKPGDTLLLIAEDPNLFQLHEVLERVSPQSSLNSIWAHSQGADGQIRKYYYQMFEVPSAPAKQSESK